MPPSGKFKRGTAESFSFEALDVGEIKEIEVSLSVCARKILSH